METLYELPHSDPPFPISHATVGLTFIFVFLLCGFITFIRAFQVEMHRPTLLNRSPKRLRVAYVAFILLGSLVFTGVFALMGVAYIDQKREYEAVVLAYERGDYEVVEGPVESFIPQPREKHAAESFEIDGVVFEYPIGHHYGYDKTYYEGGVIRWEGKILRIGYIPYKGDNLIVLIQEP